MSVAYSLYWINEIYFYAHFTSHNVLHALPSFLIEQQGYI
jgi:hypothetical protein